MALTQAQRTLYFRFIDEMLQQIHNNGDNYAAARTVLRALDESRFVAFKAWAAERRAAIDAEIAAITANTSTQVTSLNDDKTVLDTIPSATP